MPPHIAEEDDEYSSSSSSMRKEKTARGGALLPGVRARKGAQYRFVVVGPTASGKTTFCAAMTCTTEAEFLDRCGTGGRDKNHTRKFRDYESGIMSLEGQDDFSLTLKDTMGLGNHDMKPADVFHDLFKVVLNNVEAVNGFILVMKYDAVSESFAQRDLQWMKNMVQLFEADIRKQVLVVVTHSSMVKQGVQDSFTAALHRTLNTAAFAGDLRPDNVVHCNFANWTELNDIHHQSFKATHFDEWNKMQLKLREFDQPINPMRYLMGRVSNLDEMIERHIDDPFDDGSDAVEEDSHCWQQIIVAHMTPGFHAVVGIFCTFHPLMMRFVRGTSGAHWVALFARRLAAAAGVGFLQAVVVAIINLVRRRLQLVQTQQQQQQLITRHDVVETAPRRGGR